MLWADVTLQGTGDRVFPTVTVYPHPTPQIFTEGLASFWKDLEPHTLSWWSATGCYRGIAGHLWLPSGHSFVLWRWHTISNWHAWYQWKYPKTLLLYKYIYITWSNSTEYLGLFMLLRLYGLQRVSCPFTVSYHHFYRMYCRRFSYT